MTERPEIPQALWSWLTRLHALTAGANVGHSEVGERVALVASMLAHRFEAAAFNQRSLEYVAVRCTFWPAYAELVEHLTAWWRAYGPKPVMLTAPAPDPAMVKPAHGTPEHDQIMVGFVDLRAEMLRRISDRAANVARPAMALPDATLKGEALVRLRAARRAKVGA